MQNLGQLDKTVTWGLGLEVMRAISLHYRTAMRAVIKHTGVNNNWFVLYLIRGSEPETFSLNRYHQLYPFIAKDQLHNKLNELTEQEFLILDEHGTYHLTPIGRKAIERTFQMAHREMGKIRALSFQDMQHIADLLHRVVAATIHLPLPIERHMMKISRWTDVGEYAPTTTRIDQYLTDLKRYRHDAEIASWQHHCINGETWEAFTMICQGKAHTAEELTKLLHAHGHEQKTYTRALHNLEQRGWITETNSSHHYVPTELGHNIYTEATYMTEQYFYAGWASLSEQELQDLHYLLLELHNTLQQAAA